MITKENNQLVLRIDLEQNSYDAIGDLIGKVPNLIGYSDGKDFTINYLSDLGYKDDIQLGMPIIILSDEKELQEECKKLGLDIWKYDRCFKCDKPLLGSFTIDKKGNPICSYGCGK